MKTYTAVFIARKAKVPQSVAKVYLSNNVQPAGVKHKPGGNVWTYDDRAVERLEEWYKKRSSLAQH